MVGRATEPVLVRVNRGTELAATEVSTGEAAVLVVASVDGVGDAEVVSVGIAGEVV